MLPGGISMLLWATCAGWRKPNDSSCCLKTGGGGHAVLHQMLLPSFSLCLLHFSTLTSPLSVCQHFPRGGVRHGVRELGCQLLPAHSVTSSSTPQRHMPVQADSLCQHGEGFFFSYFKQIYSTYWYNSSHNTALVVPFKCPGTSTIRFLLN